MNKVMHRHSLSCWTEGWELSAKPVKTGMKNINSFETSRITGFNDFLHFLPNRRENREVSALSACFMRSD